MIQYLTYRPYEIPAEHWKMMFGRKAIDDALLSRGVYCTDCDKWIIAVEDGRLLGFGGVKFKGDTMWLRHDFVYPNHRGRGIFSAIADIKLSFPHKVARASALEATLGYYKSRGFEIVKYRKNGCEVKRNNQ